MLVHVTLHVIIMLLWYWFSRCFLVLLCPKRERWLEEGRQQVKEWRERRDTNTESTTRKLFHFKIIFSGMRCIVRCLLCACVFVVCFKNFIWIRIIEINYKNVTTQKFLHFSFVYNTHDGLSSLLLKPLRDMNLSEDNWITARNNKKKSHLVFQPNFYLCLRLKLWVGGIVWNFLYF